MELIKAIDHHNPSVPKTKQVIFCPTSQPSHSVLRSRCAFWNSGGESPTIPEVAGEFFDQLRLLSTQKVPHMWNMYVHELQNLILIDTIYGI